MDQNKLQHQDYLSNFPLMSLPGRLNPTRTEQDENGYRIHIRLSIFKNQNLETLILCPLLFPAFSQNKGTFAAAVLYTILFLIPGQRNRNTGILQIGFYSLQISAGKVCAVSSREFV